MNKRVKELIVAVADSDIQKAKQIVRIIVDEDKTKVNQYFCESIRRRLQATSINLMELPHDVRDILTMEDVSFSFNENRYYLTEREKRLYNEIYEMYVTSLKLLDMRIQYLNSIMLYGKSGTGKTLFGKFVAYKLGLPFVYMNFSNAISSYLGSTSKNIAKAFKFMNNQKCVFMIDEIDAIGMMRGREDVGEMARITISIMQALDEVKNDSIIIGATNRVDMIDTALLRRFTIKHEVLRFTKEEMEGMILKFLHDINMQYDINNIRKYCEENNSCQAVVMNDVIRAVAKSIRTKQMFNLKTFEIY